MYFKTDCNFTSRCETTCSTCMPKYACMYSDVCPELIGETTSRRKLKISTQGIFTVREPNLMRETVELKQVHPEKVTHCFDLSELSV